MERCASIPEGPLAYVPVELRSMVAEQLQRVDELQRNPGRVIHSCFRISPGPIAAIASWSFASVEARHPRRWHTRIARPRSRSAVRNMKRSGVARSVAMQITGHKTQSVYRRTQS